MMKYEVEVCVIAKIEADTEDEADAIVAGELEHLGYSVMWVGDTEEVEDEKM